MKIGIQKEIITLLFMQSAVPSENIKTKIHFLRGQKVMLDRDLFENLKYQFGTSSYEISENKQNLVS
jgi:hypothetical protein